LTDKMISDIINDMIILVDTRENKNKHIEDYFDSKNIKWNRTKLDTADYTFILPNYSELNLNRKILIERKGSLDEVAGNFTSGRERFKREFERVNNEKIHIVMENATWTKILNGSYRSKFTPRAYIASLITWNIRYKCPIWFCTKKESGEIIYNLMRYELVEQIKNLDNLVKM